MKVFLKKDISKRIQQGHNWIFDAEVLEQSEPITPLSIINVFTNKGTFIGKGFGDEQSKIKVRMLTRNGEEEIDNNWIEEKIKKSIDRRKSLNHIDACRLIHMDADGLSGLIVDKIKENIWIHCLTKPWDARKETLKTIFHRIYKDAIIFFDESDKIRQLEGMKRSDPIISSPIQIQNNNAIFTVTHPTELSLEKSEVRKTIAEFAQGKSVLDLFCGNGNLGITALANGARAVTFVDNAIPSCALQNLKNLKNANIVLENAFDYLRKEKEDVDVLILDMPPFNLQHPNQLDPYKDLTFKSFLILKSGGMMLIGNNSSKIDEKSFLSMIQSAAMDAQKSYSIIKKIPQPIDFPIHPLYEHTDYIHFYLLSIH